MSNLVCLIETPQKEGVFTDNLEGMGCTEKEGEREREMCMLNSSLCRNLVCLIETPQKEGVFTDNLEGMGCTEKEGEREREMCMLNSRLCRTRLFN